MIIDCHVHIKGGDTFKTESTAEEIIPVMDDAGIDKAVCFAMSASPVDSTEMVYREVSKRPDRLIGFTYARPMYDRDVSAFIRKAFDDYNMKGIKIHRGETSLAPGVMGPVYKAAIEYDYPCIVDTKGMNEEIKEVIVKFPDLKLIIAHMGHIGADAINIADLIDFIKPYKNVFLDTSYIPMYLLIRDAVNILGSERVIFGSDGILLSPRAEMEKIRALKFSKEQETNIFGHNIARILKIPV